MNNKTSARQCPGCLTTFPHQENNIEHYQQAGIARYGVASPECAKAFFEILAQEAELYGYPPAHRLIVDAYAVQHPPHLEHQRILGIEKRLIDASIQSINVHLVALYCAIEKNIPLATIASVMDRLLKNMNKEKLAFEPLQTPSDLGKIKAIDIRNSLLGKSLSLQEYTDLAWDWARTTWYAWNKEHDKIRKLYEKYTRI